MDSPPSAPSKRAPSSSPSKLPDSPPKQPKIPRLDPVVSTSTIESIPQSSGIGLANNFSAAPAAMGDRKAVMAAKLYMGEEDPAWALVCIVDADKDNFGTDSVFHGFGWGDREGATKALVDHPQLGQLINECIQRKTMETLREQALKLKQLKSSRKDGAILTLDSGDVQKATEEAWKAEYMGDTGKLFIQALHAMNKARTPAIYNNFVPIIQSSGMGKSRMVDEAAKNIFTLPFNLRSDADKSAYPRPNAEVRDFLKAGGVENMFKNDLEFRYLQFFKQLFDQVDAELSTLEPRGSYEAFALAWYNEFTEDKRKKLYGEVVKKSLKALENRPTGEAEAFHKTVEASVQALLATIAKRSGQSGTGRSEGDEARQPVRVMLYFDESHELVGNVTKADEKGASRTAYQVLCKSLNSITEQDVFVVHLSTNSNLSHYSPHMANFWSLRGEQPGPIRPDNLQAPFVELPFDAFAKVKERDTTLAQASEAKHMARFGRPLFHTMSESGGSLNIIKFAKQKIYGHLSKETEDGRLAALSIRMLFEFEPRRELAREKEAELVAGHMRVAYSVPKHRLYIRSGTPSEPLLAEASARIMMDGTDQMQKYHASSTILRLGEFLNHGLISKGERGELVGRLILTLAHDKAILDSQLQDSPHFSKPIGVLAFLEALISPPHFERIKKSKPANVFNGITLEEAFADAKLNFTHFVKGGDESIISDEVAWMALARCMAFACANGQRTIDLYIPILLWNETLSRWVVSGIFIQFKNRGTAEKVTIDATKLNFFTHADPGEIGDEEAKRYNTRPYITIVMNMGVKPDMRKKPEATGTQTPPMPKVPGGFSDPKATPSKVTSESGPTRAQPRRGMNARSIHPRYAINITGCSPNVYHAIPLTSKDTLSNMLATQDILHEHPRRGEYIEALLRLKPFWSKNANSFHWANVSDSDEVGDEVEGVFVESVEDDDSDVDMDG